MAKKSKIVRIVSLGQRSEVGIKSQKSQMDKYGKWDRGFRREICNVIQLGLIDQIS
jgi:hypothetical protein